MRKKIILISVALFIIFIFAFYYKFTHEKILSEEDLRKKIHIPKDTYNDVISTVISLEEDREARYNIDKIQNLNDKKNLTRS